MNDPNKRIDVNLSSLLSLKAELLRKQQEVSKVKKQDASDPFKVHVQRHSRSSVSKSDKKKNEISKPIEKPIEAPSLKTEEDTELLAKSKRVLEAKAKLYERMTKSGGSLNSDDNCLVRFNQKKQTEREKSPSSSESSSDDEVYNDNGEDDGKWVEYTDCLGRTRKCLKEDVEFFKKKDRELSEVAKNRNSQNEGSTQSRSPVEDDDDKPKWFFDTKGITSSDLPLYKPADADDTMSMISKSTKMEEMRQQWEKKEQENMDREDIHYQDVLFDEARTHGVGYYAFSVDEAERKKQQQELEAERDQTLESQKQREQLRLQREKIIAERVFAAKNRQRARSGLPPLSREEYEKSLKPEETEDSKEDRKQRKREEKEKKKKEKLELEREELRQRHVRSWDYGKDGVSKPRHSDDSDEWQYKPEKPEPMSQEQWNEQQRAIRVPEFAPPEQTASKGVNRFSTMKPKTITVPDFPPPNHGAVRGVNPFSRAAEFVPSEPIASKDVNRFSTIKPKTFKRRNIIEEPPSNMYNEPIRNELDGNDFPVDVPPEDDDRIKRRRAEIAPPPTFEYYGPTETHRRPQTTPNSDLTASIEAGLRYLREQSDKGTIGTKQKWVAQTDYGNS